MAKVPMAPGGPLRPLRLAQARPTQTRTTLYRPNTLVSHLFGSGWCKTRRVLISVVIRATTGSPLLGAVATD